jgi:predicted secreted protein
MTNYSAFGTLLQIDDGMGSFTTIGQVVNITGPGLSQDRIDVTTHSSPGGWREKVGGILDGGEVTFEINYDPADATHNATTGLIDDLQNRILRNFKLVFPDTANTEWLFSALVGEFEPAAPHDGKLTGSVTLDISGPPTLA